MVAPRLDVEADVPTDGLVYQRVTLAGREAWMIHGTIDTANRHVLVTIPAFGGSRARLQDAWMGGYWQAAVDAGFSVLALPDFTVPTTEAAIQYLRSRDENPHIVLHGFSIGASIATFAASRWPVTALVADGLADDLFDAMFVDFRKHAVLRLVSPAVRANLQWSRRIYPAALRGLQNLRQVDCPVLLVYGAEEPIVSQPLNAGLIAYAQDADRVQTWMIPNTEHCMGATEKPLEYLAQVSDLR